MDDNHTEYPFVWFWCAKLPERKGKPCKILQYATSLNSVLVQFTDGYKVITSRFAVRKRPHYVPDKQLRLF